MYRYFTKIDGLKIYIKDEDIISYEEMYDHVVVVTIMDEYEVINTLEEIFKNKHNFSNN